MTTKKSSEEIKQIFRFALTGGLGTITNMVAFSFLVGFMNVGVELGSLIGFIFAVSQNYVINHLWTFRHLELGRPSYKKWMRFTSSSLIALSVNLVVLVVLVDKGVGPFLAQLSGIFFGMMINYLIVNRYVFGHVSESRL